MSEQTNTRAQHAAALAEAEKHLNNGDAGAYWKALEGISGYYAKLAGAVETVILSIPSASDERSLCYQVQPNLNE